MGLLCGCPRGAQIADIPILDCLETAGQIQKILFTRLRGDDGSRNFFDAGNATTPVDPTLLASWTPLLSAADSTKVVVGPMIAGPENEPGEARTYGGGNSTPGGVEIILGREASVFNAMILRNSQKTIKGIKELQCETLGVYLLDEYGRIILDSDGLETPEKFYPIPIEGLFVGDKKFGGLEEPDSNSLRFNLLPNWSDNLRIITPSDFDALYDLKNPVV